ncbi:hypothetical protein DFH11DRAFT_1227426 [Phellopilus nigrolimitatus]|nr:hypothetical protein DFH11DRAFT_1236079 [Phellopilus nigrolimitatus]KAH8107312.1 hypothetical protein DFH11DRAFT_1227426 [Phellopilus nigrolimitatus]
MVFRLPTPFDSHVPASNRISPSRPWRGAFNLHGINVFRGANGLQKLFVASAETEGINSRTDLWPKHFDVHLTEQSCRLTDIQAWVRRHDLPLCMFMPDRHATGPDTQENESHFRSLARVMVENQVVCIAPWSGPDVLAGSGILILPNASSTGLLVGTIFLYSSFPEFVLSKSQRPGSAMPSAKSYSGISPTLSIPRPLLGSGASSHPHSPRHSTTPPLPQHTHSARGPHVPSSTKSSSSIRHSPSFELRQALVAVPFDWPLFEGPTDDSGSTSAGSSRVW